MRKLLSFLPWLVFPLVLWIAASASAGGPVACNGVASTGAVTSCNSGQTYGVTALSASAIQILGNDSGRTSLWYQNNGANPVVVTLGDTATAVSPYNGILLQASPTNNAFYWTNMPQGNTPGIIVSLSVSVIGVGGNSQGVFMYTH